MQKDEVEDDKSKVVKDGETVRTSVLLMDEIQRTLAQASDRLTVLEFHQPGFRFGGDRQRRRELYDRRDAELSDAWKTPSSDPAAVKEAAPKPQTISERYAARDRALEQAWRGDTA